METVESQAISALNDLIKINNDRIENYEMAVKNTEDTQLKSLFYAMEQESRKYKNELLSEVIKLGGTPEEGTSDSEKIFRVWMDFKAAVTGKSRKAIVSCCQFGEDITLEKYLEVIHSGKLPSRYLSIISEQNNGLLQSYERIKLMGETVKSL